MDFIKDNLGIITQIIGYIGSALIIASFQCKKIKNFYIMQLSGNFVFVISFLMAGSIAGAMMNLIGGIRCIIMLFGEKTHKTFVLWGIALAMIGASAFSGFCTEDSWTAIVPCIAQVSGSFSMWYGDDKQIRIIQIGIVSPFWIAYNLVKPFVGGQILGGSILCECFNIISAAVFLLRMRKRNVNNESVVNGK